MWCDHVAQDCGLLPRARLNRTHRNTTHMQGVDSKSVRVRVPQLPSGCGTIVVSMLQHALHNILMPSRGFAKIQSSSTWLTLQGEKRGPLLPLFVKAISNLFYTQYQTISLYARCILPKPTSSNRIIIMTYNELHGYSKVTSTTTRKWWNEITSDTHRRFSSSPSPNRYPPTPLHCHIQRGASSRRIHRHGTCTSSSALAEQTLVHDHILLSLLRAQPSSPLSLRFSSLHPSVLQLRTILRRKVGSGRHFLS